MKKKRFDSIIPKSPFLKRGTYKIPQDYVRRYNEEDIVNLDKQMVLFHLTQFGGFRMRRVPRKMQFDEDFKKKWCVSKPLGGGYSFKASPDFLQTFGDIEIRSIEKIWRNGSVKERDMLDCGYTVDEITDMKGFLKRLNTFYSKVRLSLEAPNSGISSEDRVQVSRFHSIPFLTVKPKTGGRLFHPETSYQRISSSLRPLMTINGEKTAELDLSAATLQFLNIALEKRNLGSLRENVLSYEDPYQYFLNELNSDANLSRSGWNLIDRDSLKTLLYTAIYSNQKEEKANLNHKLRIMKSNAKHSDFVNLFPDFFNALSVLRHSTGLPLHMSINREESQYTRSVLEKGCLEEGFSILPIHDSFITTYSHIEDLESVMRTTSEDLYSRQLVYRRKY